MDDMTPEDRQSPEGLNSRVTRLESSIGLITNRIDLLARDGHWSDEFRRQEQAHLDEKFAAIENQFKELRVQIASLQGVVSKVGWAIVLAVLTAAMTFALKGGFMA